MLINRFALMALPPPKFRFLCAFVASLSIIGCEQQIEVELPETETVYVIEGKMKAELCPLFLSVLAQGYFDPLMQVASGSPFCQELMFRFRTKVNRLPWMSCARAT